MTEINVPWWLFFTIWMSLIAAAGISGWFVRGLWDKVHRVDPPASPPAAVNMNGKRY